jgi:hypothetical protein
MRLLVMVAIAMVALAACRHDPQAKARAEKSGAGRENAEWDKAFKDAHRMEEKNRRRAEKQRQETLDKANKETEKQ